MAFIALKEVELNGIIYEPGQEIDLEEIDVRFIKFGKVKYVPDEKPKKKTQTKSKGKGKGKGKTKKEEPKEELLTEVSDEVEVNVEVVPSEDDES